MNVLYDLDKLRKVVEYVGGAQSILEKASQQTSTLSEKAPAVVDALIQQGLVSPHLKEAKVKALSENPVEILEMLEKTAALVQAPSIGQGDETKANDNEKPSADQVFVDRLMG